MQLVIDSAVPFKQLQSVFFDRPINPIRRQSIAILAGRQTSLFEIEKVFEIIRAMNHHPIIIADKSLKNMGLPAELYLEVEKSQTQYRNSEEAISLISDCQMLIAGIGLELNSSMQLLLTRILDCYQGTTVLTESTLSLAEIQDKLNPRALVFASTKGLLKNSNRLSRFSDQTGLSKKIEIISKLYSTRQTEIICVENHQIIGIDLSNQVSAIINSEHHFDLSSFLAIFTNLLSDRQSPLSDGWLDYFFAAGYLYKEVYSNKNNPLDLKDFLNSQF